MHHRLGALTETLFIYGHALDRAFDILDERACCRSASDRLQRASHHRRGHAPAANRPRRELRSKRVPAGGVHRMARGSAECPRAGVRVRGPVISGSTPAVAREWWRRRALVLRGAFPDGLESTGDRNLVYFDAYSNRMTPNSGTKTGWSRRWPGARAHLRPRELRGDGYVEAGVAAVGVHRPAADWISAQNGRAPSPFEL